MKDKPTIGAVLRELTASGDWFSSQDVVTRSVSTRQAVHRYLARGVSSGTLTTQGAGRATRYRGSPAPAFRATRQILGLAEDLLWDDARRSLPDLERPEHANAAAIVAYAFTEMVNNAIDHSGSPTVDVSVTVTGGHLQFEVRDVGVGIFQHVHERLGLPDRLAALQEISKGKTSTAPERHSGEGIFFTSKVADRLEIQANDLLWIVDNVRADHAVGTAPAEPGTAVRFEVALDKRERLESVFARYTHDFAFDTTRTVVKLFAYGVRFVSRSEAKRLLLNLERFRHVILDFRGVEAVGQGFADEVFRVWAAAHPTIEMTAENMSPPVAFMVERARLAPRIAS